MRIELASQEGVDFFREEIEEFLDFLFDIQGALVTDESWLVDFISMDDLPYEQAKIYTYTRIKQKYGIDVSGEMTILEIMQKIHSNKIGHA